MYTSGGALTFSLVLVLLVACRSVLVLMVVVETSGRSVVWYGMEINVRTNRDIGVGVGSGGRGGEFKEGKE